jgi:hypothetical protein
LNYNITIAIVFLALWGARSSSRSGIGLDDRRCPAWDPSSASRGLVFTIIAAVKSNEGTAYR